MYFPVTVVLWLVYNWHLLAYRLTVPDWTGGVAVCVIAIKTL
jgi:hypothetical protein